MRCTQILYIVQYNYENLAMSIDRKLKKKKICYTINYVLSCPSSKSSILLRMSLKQVRHTRCGLDVAWKGSGAWFPPHAPHTTAPQKLQWYCTKKGSQQRFSQSMISILCNSYLEGRTKWFHVSRTRHLFYLQRSLCISGCGQPHELPHSSTMSLQISGW